MLYPPSSNFKGKLCILWPKYIAQFCTFLEAINASFYWDLCFLNVHNTWLAIFYAWFEVLNEFAWSDSLLPWKIVDANSLNVSNNTDYWSRLLQRQIYLVRLQLPAFKEANLHRRFSIAIAKCEARKMQKRRVKDRTYYWSGFSKPKQYLLSEAQCMA